MSQNHAYLGSTASQIEVLSFNEIEAVGGAEVNWVAVGRFAGRAAGVGIRGGAIGLAAAGAAVAAYVIVDYFD